MPSYPTTKGDFRLARAPGYSEQATTREIANDAMELSMRIKENIVSDSNGTALGNTPPLELLLFQNKTDPRIVEVEDFEKER